MKHMEVLIVTAPTQLQHNLNLNLNLTQDEQRNNQAQRNGVLGAL